MNSQIPTETEKFTSDVVWSAISQVTTGLVSLMILSALTKYYTPETYGIWMQIIVTLALLAPILSLHLGTALVRFLAGEQDKRKRQQSFSAMLWPILAFTCVVFLISLLSRQQLSVFLFGDASHASLIPLTFLWVSMGTLFWFSISYLQARRKIKEVSVIRVALALGRITLIVILARAGYNLNGIIAYLVAMDAAIVAGIFGMIIREIGFPKLDFTGLKGYLGFSLPQMPSGILFWVINASDRYFITHLLNLSQAGVYSASNVLASAISQLFSPITFVLLPTVSKLWEQKEPQRVRSYLEYSTKFFLTLAIPAVAVLYILSQPLLRILTTSEFLVGGEIVLLVAVAMIFAGTYYINLYIIYLVQQTKWIPLLIGVAAMTNAVINIALIPMIGIMGAAISTIVSYSVLAAIVTVWARRAISYKMDFMFLAKVIAAALLMAFCLNFIKIGGILGIIIITAAGATIFALGLWLLEKRVEI